MMASKWFSCFYSMMECQGRFEMIWFWYWRVISTTNWRILQHHVSRVIAKYILCRKSQFTTIQGGIFFSSSFIFSPCHYPYQAYWCSAEKEVIWYHNRDANFTLIFAYISLERVYSSPLNEISKSDVVSLRPTHRRQTAKKRNEDEIDAIIAKDFVPSITA